MKVKFKDPNTIVIKSIEAKASGDDDLPEGVIKFIASTESEDRDGDVIKQGGLHLDNYKKNPVFLWAHNPYEPPIGRAIRAEVKNGRFELDVEFDMDDEFAAKIYNKYKKGHMNAVSIGFMPIDFEARDKGGFLFKESEVMEVSSVPIGSNREALAVQREYGGHVAHKSFAAYYKGIEAPEEPQEAPDTDELFADDKFKDYVVLDRKSWDVVWDHVVATSSKLASTRRRIEKDVTPDGAESVHIEPVGPLLVEIESIDSKTPTNIMNLDANGILGDNLDTFAQKVADLLASNMKGAEAPEEESQDSGEQKFAKVRFVSGDSE